MFIIHNLQNTIKKRKNKIPVHPIKENVAIPSLLLCNIINRCFTAWIFPDIYKQTTVVSFLEAADPLSPSNYRPISLLSPWSKLIEKCIYNRTFSFINIFFLLTVSQFGFLKGKSTKSAVTGPVNGITLWCFEEQGNCFLLNLRRHLMQ